MIYLGKQQHVSAHQTIFKTLPVPNDVIGPVLLLRWRWKNMISSERVSELLLLSRSVAWQRIERIK